MKSFSGGIMKKNRKIIMEVLLQLFLTLMSQAESRPEDQYQSLSIFSPPKVEPTPPTLTPTGASSISSFENSYTNSINSYSSGPSPVVPEYAQDFGSSCDANRPCNQEKYLECVDGKCICQNSLHRTYNPHIQECVNLVGNRCAHAPGPTKCVPHAICDVLGKCRCKSGFSANSQKICLLNYDQDCTAHQCNASTGLACKDNKCRCLDSLYVWTPVHQRCINPEEILKNAVKTLGKSVFKSATGGFVG